MTYHCYTQYDPKDPEVIRRNQIARQTWEQQPWTELPVPLDKLGRLHEEEGGSFPYVRDVFDYACAGREPMDIMIYTNADIQCRCDCAMRVNEVLYQADACFAYRRDFGRLDAPLKPEEYENGYAYAGSDLAAFRVWWWQRNREQMADMLIGMEGWDPVFRTLVERTNLRKPICIPNIIGHERHNSFWENPANRYRLKGQLLNRDRGARWLMQHQVDPAMHGL